jgi:hypothetical protein
MTTKDIHSFVRTKVAVAPVAIGTTGTGQVGKVIDLQGYKGVEFLLAYGSITATTAVFTAMLNEGDVTGTMTAVAAGDILGSIAAAGVAAAATRTSGVSKNVTTRIGYSGSKRYVQCGVKSTTTAGTLVSITALLHTPDVAPAANP